MTPRSQSFGWRFSACILLLAASIWAAMHHMRQPLWDEPEIVLVIGGTYEELSRSSSAPFSPQIRGHVWSGIPMTDAKMRFVDPQFGFTTPAARFFSVGFDDNIIFSVRMSPQVEPLLLDDALKVALDLQSQWRAGGWWVAGKSSYPPFADTPEWRAQLRDLNRGGSVYWKAGKKYQITMHMHRFKYNERPEEERYLITLSIGKPWTPFAEDGDEDALMELDQSTPLTPLVQKKRNPCHANPRLQTLHGEQQGLISAGAFTEASVGNAYQMGREDKIMIQALSHGIFVPKGAGAGRRMHKPLIITKSIDKASPLINNALCSGELLSQCRVEWYRISAHGVQEHFYTMELEDALIIGAEVLMPHCQDSATAHLTQLEKVHFSYRRIYWRHEISRTMGSDEWQEAQG